MRKNNRSPMDRYDKDYIFRPDLRRIRYIVHRPRKTVFINIDADPDATEVKIIERDDCGV